MEVKSGAEWQLPTGNKQYFDVTLSEADGQDSVESWASMTVRSRFKWLSAEADILVVFQMASVGALSKEMVENRIALLKAKQKSVLAGSA